jgi:hypothetical protein
VKYPSPFSCINKSEDNSEERLVATTKKISQLDNVTDEILTGEAILPVVIADPLTPNRKAKVNQLFKGVSGGSINSPGLSFDLDRSTGLYQNNYEEIGISFGSSAFYLSKIVESSTFVTNRIQALAQEQNANITFQPKGSGVVSVQSGSLFRLQDSQFEIVDDTSSARRARFELSGIGTGLRLFALPTINVGNSTTLVGTNTNQTLTNKIIRVDTDDLFIFDGNKEAKFGIDWIETPSGTKTYFFPDPGPGITQSNIVDDISTQTISNKTLVQPSMAANATTQFKVLFDSSQLTQTRTVIIPDINVRLLGDESTQVVSNKTYLAPIFADPSDQTKKVNFEFSNLVSSTNNSFSFPTTLNNAGATSILVTERATQTLRNKSYDKPEFVDIVSVGRRIRFDLSNITSTRVISFPDEDATLLSTSNTSTLEGIAFSGSISADSFGGRLRLRTHFLAGW